MIPLKDPAGEVKEVLVVSRDIDEYKILQSQSRKTLDLLQTVVEGFPLGIELLDSKGMLIMANREFRKIFGVSDAKSTIRLNPLIDPNLPGDLRERLDRHRPVRYEITYDFSLVKERKLYRSSRIGLVSLEIRVVPLLNKNRGTLNGYLVLVRDITHSTTKRVPV